MISSIKSFLIRLIVYPFCFFIIYWGIEMICNYEKWSNPVISQRQFVAGIGVIIVALVFLISDILIIIKSIYKKKE